MTRWIDVNVVVSESQHPKVSMAQSLKNPEPLESFFMAKSSRKDENHGSNYGCRYHAQNGVPIYT